MEKLKTIELTCEKESLFSYSWLFNNIPWSNFDGENVKISFDSPIEAYTIEIDGADTNIKGLKKFYFDSVIITAFHATQNHFTFVFNLAGEKTHISYDERALAFSIDELKIRQIEKLNSRIKGLHWQIGNVEAAIEKINGLTL